MQAGESSKPALGTEEKFLVPKGREDAIARRSGRKRRRALLNAMCAEVLANRRSEVAYLFRLISIFGLAYHFNGPGTFDFPLGTGRGKCAKYQWRSGNYIAKRDGNGHPSSLIGDSLKIKSRLFSGWNKRQGRYVRRLSDEIHALPRDK
jgi:hypothetical protein